MTEEELIKKRQEKMIDKLLKAGIYKYKDTHLYELTYAEVRMLIFASWSRKKNNPSNSKKEG
ncbi:hypothetical protein JCM19047_646 [Bacillus sp. JCM 19047]|nr:hypothetical protein JCM19047_646 [Bacillus sp. JCM 19047]